MLPRPFKCLRCNDLLISFPLLRGRARRLGCSILRRNVLAAAGTQRRTDTLHEQVHRRRDVERQQLRYRETANHREAERLSKLGIVPGGMSVEQSLAVFQRDRAAYAAAIKAAGIESPK